MKHILGLVIILLSFGASAQDSEGVEPEQQILVDKVHTEPIKLEDKKAKKKSDVQKKNGKAEKAKTTGQ